MTYLVLPVHLNHVLQLGNVAQRKVAWLSSEIRKAGEGLHVPKKEVE